MASTPKFSVQYLAFSILLLLPVVLNAGLAPLWPTPNTAFAEGKPIEAFIQPTETGDAASGCYGCVRNNGFRFHEGIDIKCLRRDRQGEPEDEVYAAMDGRVAYINNVAGRSEYGRYIVLEHEGLKPPVCTFYGHLSQIAPGLKAGGMVKAGDVLGIMGRSGISQNISKERAHLHFETGLRLSDDFQGWYKRQGFKGKNYHGNYNGGNLLGFDPLDFFIQCRSGKIDAAGGYLKRLPIAYAVRVNTPRTPDFVRRHPELLTESLPEKISGWEIEFTAFGLPVKWKALRAEDASGNGREGKINLLWANREMLQENNCRKTIVFDKNGPRLGENGLKTIQLLFGLK